MAKYTRGEFLGFGAALAGAFSLGKVPTLGRPVSAEQPPSAAGPGVEADLIVVNARVFTSDGARPRAEAFAVKNGRFIAAGSTVQVRKLPAARTRVLAGITNDTPDPPDGRFFRENGELTGRVAENARGVFNRVGKRETFTPEQRRDRARDGMRHMSQLFSACGLTSVHNAGTNSE